jgi:Kef-type K+ transport system membrane component KefB
VIAPLLNKVKIPSVIAMIFMGCIARNFFGKPVEAYNNEWAQWLRSCCLAILLTRGGLQVSFSGKGIIVVFLSFVPQLFEATTLALMGLWAFKFPIEVSFTFGFTIATVGSAIVVPSLMKWNEQGYGVAKGIAPSLIAACTFDNIICLIMFGVCKTVTFEHAAEIKNLGS